MSSIEDWDGEIVAFDTETTGANPLRDRIVSATVVCLNADGTTKRLHEWLVNPGVPILETATEVHGITNEVAERDGEDPADAATEIVRILTKYTRQGYAIAAYNAVFDFTILKAEAERHGIDWTLNATVVDPFVIDKNIDMYRKGSRKLTDVAELYGVTLEDAHDATADAVAAGQLAQAIIPRAIDEYPDIQHLRELHQMQVDWKVEQTLSYQAYKRREEPDFTLSTGWPFLERPLLGIDTKEALQALIEDLENGCKRDHAIAALESILR